MESKDYQVVFTWAKSLGGYDWEDCKIAGNEMSHDKDSVKVPMPPYLIERDCSKDIEGYNPFDDITLFTNFADTCATADSFKAWASKYGMLVRGEKLSPSGRLHVLSENAIALGEAAPYGILLTLKDGTKGRLQPSESQCFWFKEHHDLSFTVMLWELGLKKDMKQLGEIVQWTSDNKGIFIYKTTNNAKSFELLTDGKIVLPWVSNLIRYPDLIRPAMLYVQTKINEKLKTYPLNVVIQTDERGKLYKTLQPTSLLSAMWYQFFLVFTGEENIRRCAICGKWENMKGHRDTWKKHATCASNERVKRFRKPDNENKDK